MMTIGSEVFGRCVEEINASIRSINKKKLGFAVLWDDRLLSVVDGKAIEGKQPS